MRHDETLRALIERWEKRVVDIRALIAPYEHEAIHQIERCIAEAKDLETLLSPVDRPRGHEQEQADPTRVDKEQP